MLICSCNDAGHLLEGHRQKVILLNTLHCYIFLPIGLFLFLFLFFNLILFYFFGLVYKRF